MKFRMKDIAGFRIAAEFLIVTLASHSLENVFKIVLPIEAIISSGKVIILVTTQVVHTYFSP